MSQQELALDEQAGVEAVDVRLRAELTHLFAVRAVATTIALREDFDVDAVADFTLAADQVCAALVADALPAETLHCRFTIGRGSIGLLATVASRASARVDRQSFGWRVLGTLVDSLSTRTTLDGRLRSVVAIRIGKKR